MEALLKVLNDTIFTLVLVLIVVVGFYAVRHRRLRGFFRYVGLKKTPTKAIWLSVGVAVLNIGVFLSATEWLLPALLGADAAAQWTESPNTTGNALLATGSTGPLLVFAALLKGGVQTAFIEELFFRGFIAKRLINRLGYRAGNALQSLLFAAMHMIFPFLLGMEGAASVALVFGVMTGTLAWILGALNEHVGEGSMVPGWIVHGLGNAVTYVLAVATPGLS